MKNPKDKSLMIWTSVIILLPALVGLLLWNRLPEQMPTHWGADGQVDGWSGKLWSILLMPLLLLPGQWVVYRVTRLEPQNRSGSNAKVLRMVMWIFPILSVVFSGMMYGQALGWKLGMETVIPLLISAMFLVVGNVLPKCRRNSFLGIRLPWTFSSEENWNRTHRLGGKTWVIGGIVSIVALAVGWLWLYILAVFAACVIPCVYSWLFYRKQRDAGQVEPILHSKQNRVLTWVTIAVTVFALVFVGWALFSGSMDITLDDTHLTITTDQWDDLTVDISAIDSAEYRENGVDGSRDWGYGNLTVGLGTFSNNEFGAYTRYTYVKPDGCIVLHVGEKVLVINDRSDEATRALYEKITETIAK